jgi:mRNA interferase RelE/StbE
MFRRFLQIRLTKRLFLLFITEIQKDEKSSEIKNLKKHKCSKYYYRIRTGDYRIGLYIAKKEVEFIRFLHRKDVYKFFP